MQTALFIGRFQPFHKGHFSVIKKIYPLYERIVIGIGSAEDNYLAQNPFTANERYEMIFQTLRAEGFDLGKIAIVPVRNINNYALWVNHIELIFPDFQHVYTGSTVVRRLFAKNPKYKVHSVSKKYKINATQVRHELLMDNNYQEMLPKTVVKFLDQINAVERIKDIQD